MNSTELDAVIAKILDDALGVSRLSLRQLSDVSGVKLTRLGDVLRRGRAITTGELTSIASALGMTGSQVMREAEARLGNAQATHSSSFFASNASLSTVATVASDASVPAPMPSVGDDEDLPDFTLLAARTVTHRPGWDAASAYDAAGEESQDLG